MFFSVIVKELSKLNFFRRELNGFYNNIVSYTDTDSLYIERKYWYVLNKAKLVGGGLCQGKIDYGDDNFMFYGLFLTPNIKFVFSIDEYGTIQAYKTFKGYTDSKRLLDHVQKCKKVEVKNFLVMLPMNWKKSFYSGIIIPSKMKRCKKCNIDITCDECIILLNENKQFEVDLDLLKQKPSNQFGHTLPYYQK